MSCLKERKELIALLVTSLLFVCYTKSKEKQKGWKNNMYFAQPTWNYSFRHITRTLYYFLS